MAVDNEGATRALAFPPKYGADTRRVLAQAGYAPAEIDALAAAGIVACADAPPPFPPPLAGEG